MFRRLVRSCVAKVMRKARSSRPAVPGLLSMIRPRH